MPTADSDPRVYFAAERTLLAWLRTGLTVMAFGFVIARFGLLLQAVVQQAPGVIAHPQSAMSRLLGVALIGIGTVMVLAASVQHFLFVATLPPSDRPPGYHGGALLLVSSALITLVGIALSVYLALSLS